MALVRELLAQDDARKVLKFDKPWLFKAPTGFIVVDGRPMAYWLPPGSKLERTS